MRKSSKHRTFLMILAGSLGGLALATSGLPATLGSEASAAPSVFEGPVPRVPSCAPGDHPETGIQGEVPIADRKSGRSQEGYNCNLELIGHYGRDEGFEGASWQATYFGDCGYYATAAGTQTRRGVQVIDASDRAQPKFVRNLTTPGMLDPWESLKVHPGRALLAGVMLHTNGPTPFFTGSTAPGWFDVYDVSGDCKDPKLLSSKPFAGAGHEGNWSADGKTFYAISLFPGLVTAIDVDNPTNPVAITSFNAEVALHGLGTSADGNRLYLASINDDGYFTAFSNRYVKPVDDAYGYGSRRDNNGLVIIDVSEIQARKPNPQVKRVSTLFWKDGQIGQHAMEITKDGEPYVVFVDEYGGGGPRIIDISDEKNPVTVSKLKTEILMPENIDKYKEGRDYNGEYGGWMGGFTYNSHYCSVDRPDDPTILACSNFESGVRIFDIRDFSAPREIAYYNPGGDGRRAPASFGGTTGGYTSAAPNIIEETGEIWFTDQDRGFYVTRFAAGVWPFES